MAPPCYVAQSQLDQLVALVEAGLDLDQSIDFDENWYWYSLTCKTCASIKVINFHKRKLCNKMVPKNLTNRKNKYLDLLDRMANELSFFSRVSTADELWICEYDSESKKQSEQWHTASSLQPKKARMNKSKIKPMLICF